MSAASLPPERRGLLITRPEPGATDTAQRVAALGWQPVVASLLDVRPREALGPAAVDAVLVTSANALPALGALRHLPLFAVGDATAAQAQAAGFATVHSAGADAAALQALVAARCRPGQRVLLASGAGQGLALAAGLRAAGLRVLRRLAYAAVPLRALPPAAAAALAGNGLHAALFFSPATARAFVSLLRAARRNDDVRPLEAHDEVRALEALAISAATAAPLAALPWRRIRVASHPNQDEMLAMLP